MPKRLKKQYDVIETVCNHIHIMFPLSDIGKIIAKKDIQKSPEHESRVIYQEREYDAYSLSQLLKRENENEENYAILIQNEDIEGIVYVEEVKNVKRLDNYLYDIPAYLQDRGMDYIVACHKDENGNLAFQIDFVSLLKKSYNL